MEKKIYENSGMLSVVNVKKLEGEKGIYGTANLITIIILEKEKTGYKGIVRYVLSKLLEKIPSDEELNNLERIKKYLEPFRKNWYLMGGYVEEYLNQNNLPPAERLIELSASKYEGSESEARIYFSKNHLDVVSEIQSPLEKERMIQPQKSRMIRKLMELSKGNAIYLYAEKKNEEFMITELVQVKLDKKDEKDEESVSTSDLNEKVLTDTYVKFSGFLCWSIMDGEREALTYKNGRYEVNYSERNYEYIQKIEDLKGFIGDETSEMLKELVKILKQQKHGTIAIVSDYAGELCFFSIIRWRSNSSR